MKTDTIHQWFTHNLSKSHLYPTLHRLFFPISSRYSKCNQFATPKSARAFLGQSRTQTNLSHQYNATHAHQAHVKRNNENRKRYNFKNAFPTSLKAWNKKNLNLTIPFTPPPVGYVSSSHLADKSQPTIPSISNISLVCSPSKYSETRCTFPVPGVQCTFIAIVYNGYLLNTQQTHPYRAIRLKAKPSTLVEATGQRRRSHRHHRPHHRPSICHIEMNILHIRPIVDHCRVVFFPSLPSFIHSHPLATNARALRQKIR